jgi:DNA-binding transcriptional MerR regulator
MPSPARLTISEVHKRTGIPVTTLRFYEKELPDFFSVEKTAGGHRRYTEESVRQFAMVRKMVDTDGVRLGDLREKLVPKNDGPDVRRHVDLLLSVYEAMTSEIERLKVRVESLEILLAAKKPVQTPPPQPAAEGKKRRWF